MWMIILFHLPPLGLFDFRDGTRNLFNDLPRAWQSPVSTEMKVFLSYSGEQKHPDTNEMQTDGEETHFGKLSWLFWVTVSMSTKCGEYGRVNNSKHEDPERRCLLNWSSMLSWRTLRTRLPFVEDELRREQEGKGKNGSVSRLRLVYLPYRLTLQSRSSESLTETSNLPVSIPMTWWSSIFMHVILCKRKMLSSTAREGKWLSMLNESSLTWKKIQSAEIDFWSSRLTSIKR